MRLLELFNLVELKSSELEQIRDIMNNGSENDLFDYLENNGWDKFGNGLFSNVYRKEGSPYVIKVLRRGLDMREHDVYRKALQWLRYSQKNYLSNPHLPRVYYIQTMEVAEGKTLYLIVVETLTAVEEDGYMKALLGNIDPRVRAYVGASLLKHHTLHRGNMGDVAAQVVSNYIMDNNEDPDFNFEDNPDEGVARVFDEAVASGFPLAVAMELVDEMNMTNDLHGQNIMMRGDGTLVINDPFIG